jgi:formaldehyde-activating enzyme involved in methanogenesis
MALDFTVLNATIAALTAQVTATVGVEDSASVLIGGFSAAVAKAVADALAANEVTNQATLQAVNDAIAGVTTQFTDSAAKLGTAVAANPVQ